MFINIKLGWLYIFVIFANFLQGQVAPGIEWRVSNWSPRGLNGNFQTREQSGEEWWYSHKNVYNSSGTHTAYVTVGYTSLVSDVTNFADAQLLYNEGLDSPYNPITSSAYNYSVLPEGCSDRDYLGEHRTPPRGNIGMNDLNGKMIYCKPKTIGALEEVIQDPLQPNYFYVVGVHLGVKPYKNKNSFIPYNPTASNPANYFSLQAMGLVKYTNDAEHLYVAKIDAAGTVIWEGLYGLPNYSVSPLAAYEMESYGNDIIKSSNGNLIVTGLAQTEDAPDNASYPIVMEIEPNTGFLIKKTTLNINTPLLGPISNPVKGVVTGGIGRSLVEIGNSRIYAVAITSYFANTDYRDFNNAFVWALNENLVPTTSWPENPVRFSGTGPLYNSNIWEIKYHKGLKQLLIPVALNCYNCRWAGYNSGEGFIYRLDSTGAFSSKGINPAPMGYLNAFDLRIGVEETSDNGFVAVSSVRAPVEFFYPTDEELGYLASCKEINTTDWETDALIIKYNDTAATQWRRLFDLEDNRSRMPPPGDLKRQECVYKITQAQDGGFVISGNSSGNFDDFYMAKLYNGCNAENPYVTGASNIINITSNTLWNSSRFVVGKVVVNPGAVLTIDGPSTVVRFADSKLTGIETNITVMHGGSLKLTNGAQLSSIDTNFCKNSTWDGIKYTNDINEINNMIVFPNPANSSFYFLYNGTDESQYVYSFTDVLGRLIKTGYTISDFATEINSASFSAGVYFLNLYKNDILIEQKKIIIIK